ncbi:putative spermidine/putrescine transport system ATP-binding protein [Micromonospora sp. Llam0]|uniref:ABC transporter ATP-binding protein n=1 Tax=Micromonospora sp. Llam0 TaxID=2485143 RepID=UPI000F471E7F|nr:ABC transporter ATP-binding protein [Micromonospora sp. Llam0]ROO51990.1 putative spermidine/putrescine transport system ATP-binding protein [Micromonospora sp. Llam0]
MTTDVTIDALDHTYPGAAAPTLRRVSLEVPAGTRTAILGPSGSGKSTLLSIVAGLTAPTGGDVRFAGRSVLRQPAHRRDLGVVFQRPLLFPHLTVSENVAFGLRMRGTDRTATRRRVGELLDAVALVDYAGRRSTALSGGQQQRVALARALAARPAVLLLDEPFSALDPQLRASMRTLLADLHQREGTTTLFVTHDRDDAVDVADQVAVLLDGHVAQHAPPADLFRRSATLAVARFLGGAVNVVAGSARPGRFDCPLGSLHLDTDHRGPGLLLIRPEAIVVADDQRGDNVVPATVTAVTDRGTHLDVRATSSGLTLQIRVGPATPLRLGDEPLLWLPPAHLSVVTP